MTKRQSTIILIAVGLFVLVAIVGVSAAAWFFTTAMDVGSVDEPGASRSFDEVRQRFGERTPVFAISNGAPVLQRQPPPTASPAALQRLVVLAWDPDDKGLVRIAVPLWLLRLKSGPIEIVSDLPGVDPAHLNVTVEQLERYGPALLVDHRGEGGDRLLMWTE